MSDSRRLAFALKNLEATDWHAFEQFASAFLAVDYPDLRVIAGTGDKGRDAVFRDAGSGVVVQYSIVEGWRSKISDTIATLNANSIELHTLVYATNREIGPKSDDLRRELRRQGVDLDVIDATYFLARIEKSAETRAAAREICARVVDPLIPSSDAVRNSPLDTEEMKAGLLYLELLLQDADQHRSLTKLTYESVVLGVLATTTPEQRRSRQEIRAEVARRFPGHHPLRLHQLVDGAIQRLNQKGRVTYQKSTDSFALHYVERLALLECAARLAEERASVRSEIALIVADCTTELELPTQLAESDAYVDAIEGVIEVVLQRQGNTFVAAFEAGEASLKRLDLVDIVRVVVYPKAAALRAASGEGRANVHDLVELGTDTVTRLMAHPGEAMQIHLRRLADSYTLLAFLQQTPDIQKTVSQLFSRGKLVLDTSTLLPTFVETGLAPEEQAYSNVLRAARSAGIELFVTDGVLNEIETHLARSAACARQATRWQGEAPFVYHHWVESWPGKESFDSFVAKFVGAAPAADIADFLQVHLGIQRIDLSDTSRLFDMTTIGRVTEIWRQRKQRRYRGPVDEMSLDIRLNHDVEMYLGVLAMRKNETREIYGYEAWLVTLDNTAFRMRDLAASEGIVLLSSPAMHPNFLSKFAGQPEYFIRRKLREAMDRLKSGVAVVDDGAISSVDFPDLAALPGALEVEG
jgi:hypothetical protein